MNKFTLLKSTVLSAFVIGAISTSSGQTGPGGILSSSEVQIWIDANEITGASNGSPIATWQDISGNGNNFSQGMSSRQPIYRTGGTNGHPYVDFNTHMMDSPSIPALETREITWVMMGTFDNTWAVGEIAINHNYSNHPAQYFLQYRAATGNIENYAYALNGYAAAYSHTLAHDIHMGERNNGLISSYENGALMATQSCNPTSTPTGHQFCRIGALADYTTPQATYKGSMYETIIFSAVLNSAEKNILNNYLGAKYNVTIANDDYAYETTYGHNLIGIGQESDGSNTSATGRGIVTISGATNLDDGEYLYMADDNVDFGAISNNVPASLPGHERFDRLWRIDEVGDVGDITVVLDMNTYAPGPDHATTRMLVNSLANGTDMSLATPIVGVYNAGANTMTFTYSPTAGDYISFCSEDQDIYSITSGDWSTASTWSCTCIPTGNDSVTVRTGDNVTVNGQTRASRTILIQSGGTLDITNGGQLSISGTLESQGDFDVTSGTVVFNSAGTQTVNLSQDADIDNITVQSGSTLSITGGTNVIINGTLDINADINNSACTLIINSTAAGDGRVGSNTGYNFSNDVTIRRYLPAGDAQFREITPLSFLFQFQQYDDEMIISGGGFPDGCATQGSSCYHSIKYYDGTDWQDVTSLTTNYAGWLGYRMWVGDDMNTWSGATLESTGTLKSGPILSIGFDEWNFVGNSYPSAIDFDLLQAASSNMDVFFYIYNPNTASYEWYDNGATGVLDKNIAMGQGFWVKSSNGSPVVLGLNESHKTATAATFKRPDQLSGLIMKISSAKSPYSSKVAFNTSNQSTVFSDSKDLEYLPTYDNSAPHLAVLNEYGKEMMVNYFNENDNEAQFTMLAEVPETGYYTIDVENLKGLSNYGCIHLIDIETNEIIDLRKEKSYTFFTGVLKTDSPRFIVSFSDNGCEEATNESTLSLVDEAAEGDNIDVRTIFGNVQVNFDFNEMKEVDINVTNGLGQIIYNVQSMNFAKGSHTFNVNSTGVVFVNFIYDNKVVTKKVFISK